MFLREEGVAEAPLVVSAREGGEERPSPVSREAARYAEHRVWSVCVSVWECAEVCECAPRGAEPAIYH